jgi:polyisoprenoid-binding protein YceI
MSTATLVSTPAVWQIDAAHSSAQFSVRHLMISNVRGEFTKVTGTIEYDPANLANSKVDVAIDADSINTRDTQRDAHLKSPDFFDTAQFPTLTFRSTNISKSGDGVRIKGDLTIHGVTREVVLDVEGPTPETKDPWGFTRIAASATTRINRKDFGLTWNTALETGGVVVGDEVKITLDLEAVKQQQ